MPDKIFVSGNNIMVTIIGGETLFRGKTFFISTSGPMEFKTENKITLGTLVRNLIKHTRKDIPSQAVDQICLKTNNTSPPFLVHIKG